MKKIIVFILCLIFACAIPVVAFAEDYEVGDVFEGEVPGDETTPEDETPTEEEIQPPAETPEEPPVVDEIPEENPPVETPEEKPPVEDPPAEDTPPTIEEEVEIVTEQIVAWLTANVEEIGVVVTLVGYGIVIFNRIKLLIKSTGTINNNAITISKNSSEAISNAVSTMEKASNVVMGYDVRMAALLEAFKATAEDKARLEAEIVEIKNYLKTSSQSNLEFADELAELLALSNIPNCKKEEIGARHLAAKRAIVEAAAKAETAAMLPTTTGEVRESVGEEA